MVSNFHKVGSASMLGFLVTICNSVIDIALQIMILWFFLAEKQKTEYVPSNYVFLKVTKTDNHLFCMSKQIL